MGEISYLFNLVFTYPIFNVLMLLFHLFGDFGLSIIVLTLIIRLVLVPLTFQQLRSAKSMQVLQPRMAEIRQKYAKDQQTQAREMQTLYKEYGVNPLAGCLPLLVQLPVLYGLFFALNAVLNNNPTLKSINNIIYPFLPHFTKMPDLALKWFTFLNPAWQFPLSHADPTHVLPILAGIATFVSLRMSQPKTVGTTKVSDPSTQSMKTMQYVMPFITVFFAWNFSAGLALYWTVSSVFQAIQQYFVTGWGALLVAPNFLGKPPTTTNGVNGTGNTKKKSTALVVEQAAKKQGEDSKDQLQTTTARSNGTSSAPRRRQGSSSASVRHRSSNHMYKRKGPRG